MLNLTLVRKLGGLDEAALLCYLITKYNLWYKKDQLKDSEWFYATIESIQNDLLILEKMQRRIIKELEGKKLLRTKMQGTPMKKYFAINFDNVTKLFEQ